MFPKRREKEGFTLVELVVVLAILAILTTMAMTATTGLVDQTRYDKTVELLDNIEDAIFGESKDDGTANGFIADIGWFPITDYSDPLNTVNELVDLSNSLLPIADRYNLPPDSSNPTQWLTQGWNGPYIKIPFFNNNDPRIKDGWGNPIETNFTETIPGQIQNAWIKSRGPDGVFGTNDDLSREYIGIIGSMHGPDLYGSVIIYLEKPENYQKYRVDSIKAGIADLKRGIYSKNPFKVNGQTTINLGINQTEEEFQYDHIMCGMRAVYINIPGSSLDPPIVDYERSKIIKIVPGGVTKVTLTIPVAYMYQ